MLSAVLTMNTTFSFVITRLDYQLEQIITFTGDTVDF